MMTRNLRDFFFAMGLIYGDPPDCVPEKEDIATLKIRRDPGRRQIFLEICLRPGSLERSASVPDLLRRFYGKLLFPRKNFWPSGVVNVAKPTVRGSSRDASPSTVIVSPRLRAPRPVPTSD